MRLMWLWAKPSAVVYVWIGNRSAKSGDTRIMASTRWADLIGFRIIPPARILEEVYFVESGMTPRTIIYP
jgi:hypothetical protein